METTPTTAPGATPATSVAAENPSGSNTSQPSTVVSGSGSLPSVEEILRKRAAGEKLSRAEAGKIGGAFRGGRKPPEPGKPKVAARGPVVESRLETEGPPIVPPPPPVDPDLCRQTASEILDTLNEAGQNSIASKCDRIKAAPADTARFKDMAALKPGTKTTMVNTSPSWLPKLLRVAGLDPNNASDAMAGVAGVVWAVGFYRATSALDKLAKVQPEPPTQQAAKPNDTTAKA